MSEYEESIEVAAGLAQGSLARMAELIIAAHPHNYEVWYNYLGERDADLKRHIDLLLGEGVAFTPELNRELFERYFGPSQAREAIRGTSERMAEEIERVLDHLESAGRDSRAYGDRLADAARRLERLDHVSELLRAVLADTRRMEHRTRELESALAHSAEQVAGLRAGLARIQRDAHTDALTGLANRKSLDERLQLAIEEAQASGRELCLLLADVDHFKEFNDRFGHAVGDRVLRLVAHCLSQLVRPPCTAARFGGEEFAAVLPSTTLAEAEALAERLRLQLEGQRVIARSGRRVLGRVTMSFGVARYRPGEAKEDLIERADRALYAAKHAGRNRVVCEEALAIGSAP